MGDIQDDIENMASELKDGDDQHLGDAMDDADGESEAATEQSEAAKKRRLA
jgi:hypothetical protein